MCTTGYPNETSLRLWPLLPQARPFFKGSTRDALKRHLNYACTSPGLQPASAWALGQKDIAQLASLLCPPAIFCEVAWEKS